MWGHEDSTNLLTDIPTISGVIPYYKIYDLTNMNNMLNVNKDLSLPFLQTINGKEDDNTCWEEKVGIFNSVQQYNCGGAFFWDLRSHGGGSDDNLWPPISNDGMLRYKTNLTYPAFSNCSLDGNPGDTDNPNPPYYDGDDVGSLHGSLDWVDYKMIDAVDVWEVTLFIGQDTMNDLSLIPATLPPFATCNVTIRRAQNFKGFPPATKLCWSNYHDGQMVQSGNLKQKYKGTKPKSLTIKGVKVYADTSRFRVELCNPLKLIGNPVPANSNEALIYPNPFNDHLTLNIILETASEVEVEVFNMLGELMMKKDFGVLENGQQFIGFDTGALGSGIYLLKLKTNGSDNIYKVIKE
jgi:hypothetical protein